MFADYGSGRFWAARPDGQGGYVNDELIDTSNNPVAFGIGPDDELYFVDIGRGSVFRLDPAGSSTPDTIPDLRSDTGFVDPAELPVDRRLTVAGAITGLRVQRAVVIRTRRGAVGR